MKTSLKSLLIAALAGLASLSVAQAQSTPPLKIVVIDLAKVFDNYYATKQQNDQLTADKAKADAELQAMDKDRSDLVARLRKLVSDVQGNPLITAEAKTQAEKDAQQMQADIQSKTNDLQNAMNNLRAQFQQRLTTYKGVAITDINKVAVAVAKSKGATLLIDKSNNTAFQTSSFIYIDPAFTEITDEVLAQMNQGHPMPEAASMAPSTEPSVKVNIPGASK